MIQHLNHLNFKDFGLVESERNVAVEESTAEEWKTLTLNWNQYTVYQAVEETRIINNSGMAVLSVSLDGIEYRSFYLDKRVHLNANVFFYLSPFYKEQATVKLLSQEEPELICVQTEPATSLVQSSMHVTEIYTLFYHEKERGFFFAGESHPVLELTYVDQGTVHSVADGQELILEQGDMVFYGANQWHMQYADIDMAPRYVTLSFEIEGGDLDALLNRKIRPPQAAITLVQQILREQERMEPYAMDMIASMLTQLLLILLRHQAPTGKLMASNSMNSENAIIRRAQQYICDHIREKLTVPVVARMVDVSPSYMTALFHKNLQISPGEYIRRIKIQESKQMIREGNLNFTEIAAELHYSTVHHFSRQFKDKFGITPTEYAKSVR
ncbi:MAG: AraC family transcriptional regulator [Ruminococcaceae bacterium]|nr:AraC family transcriptional regulator [Oscillospiraceae bacterium]